MKNLLALVGLVVVVVAGAGWYLDWYKLGTEPTGSGHTKTEIDWNTDKIKEDGKKVREALSDILDHNGKKVEAQPTSRPLDPPPGGWTLPQLPSLPPTPSAAPVEFNSDGSLKITVLPPPPIFPGNK